jgi:hypothetical protein
MLQKKANATVVSISSRTIHTKEILSTVWPRKTGTQNNMVRKPNRILTGIINNEIDEVYCNKGNTYTFPDISSSTAD